MHGGLESTAIPQDSIFFIRSTFVEFRVIIVVQPSCPSVGRSFIMLFPNLPVLSYPQPEGAFQEHVHFVSPFPFVVELLVTNV